MSTPTQDQPESVWDEMKNPPNWVFIAAPIITLVVVVIIAIIVLVVQRKKVKEAQERQAKKGVSSIEAELLGIQ